MIIWLDSHGRVQPDYNKYISRLEAINIDLHEAYNLFGTIVALIWKMDNV